MTWFLVGAALIAGLVTGGFSGGLHAGDGPTPEPVVQWSPDPTNTAGMRVEVIHLPMPSLRLLARTNWALPQWQRLLPVYAESGNIVADMDLPPMAGTYRILDGTLLFQPTFPLEPGIRYRAVFRSTVMPGEPLRGSSSVGATHQTPVRAAASTTVVTQIFPTTNLLPENLLKFYLQFSAPMSRGHIYDFIRLKDSTGKGIELPFLEIDEELWNPAMTRLTLFLDPGRIKRGVRPLEEVGPSLEIGRFYTLSIDRAWPDAEGNPMQSGFEKSFRVGPPDREPPDPELWKLSLPASGTRDAFVIRFNEPLDHAVIQRLLRVVAPQGQPVSGQIRVTHEERHWTLTPDQPWRTGDYQLRIPATIEDLAGNNVGRAFEVDLTANPPPRLTNSILTRTFQIR